MNFSLNQKKLERKNRRILELEEEVRKLKDEGFESKTKLQSLQNYVETSDNMIYGGSLKPDGKVDVKPF